ncbi:BZ3500_MvSof-1268-A1-R1_Chr4-2g06903 [Microbotryum saponariae]|uniref:BZ3500_MvSof-1268-A1-R1_Chr4-2g06903 protein n=1 Tax=Microbotryum saponariae TaxID=289078 RepID=A0A2X0LMX5_9BASI|nr:BZ3500_MvSof-1268-A1-R1_Chr4-2g06903 [Microbotryum saponariae]SDA06568.1 BZ3501_MvSof-1269-A2-R1_Chr4-2g06614 [Microbotryum saponariae]
MDLAPVPNVAFAAAACLGCYQAPPNTSPLSRCSGCKRVKFCSKECSVKEWPDHKSFCRAFGAMRKRPQATLPPMYQLSSVCSKRIYLVSISDRRQTHRAQFALEDELMAAALKRQPTMLESKLLWREPRCAVCWDREADVEGRDSEHEGDSWRVCPKCRIMPWCSEWHEKGTKEEHLQIKGDDGKTQCETFQLSNEIDEFYLRHAIAVGGEGSPPSLWVPTRILNKPAALPANWPEYLSTVEPPPRSTQAEVYGVFVEALSPVFTILASLRRLFPTSTIDSASSLRLIFLEETHQTLSSILPAFEELQHILPSLHHLELVAHSLSPPSGAAPPKPRTVPLPLCPACTKSGRTRSITHHQGSWPALNESIPSLAISLNSTLSQSLLDPTSPDYHKPALQSLFQAGTPILFTAQTEEESTDDLNAIFGKEMGWGREMVKVEWEPVRNRWSGGWPRLDGWEEDGYWKKNGWTFCIGKA